MVPEGWAETRLGWAAQVSPRTKRPTEASSDVSFLAMADVSESAEVIQFASRKLSEVQSGFTIFARNDILIAKITPCFENGKGAFVSKLPTPVGYGSTEFHVIRAKVGETYPSYLHYLVNSVPFRERGARNMQGSAGQRRVPTDFVKAYPLHLPPLPEQSKIADILSTWDRAIEKTEALLANARTQKRALMQSLLTGKRRFPAFEGQPWKEVRLGDVLDMSYGKSPKEVFKDNGKYPVLGTGGETGRTDTALADGPVIIIGRKGTIDAPQWVDGKFWCIDTTYFCMTNDEHDLRWLFAWLRSINLRIYNEASGVPSLSRETLRAIKFMVPSKPEQSQIADVFVGVDVEIKTIADQIDKLRTEKKALMQQLLTGKRRVVV